MKETKSKTITITIKIPDSKLKRIKAKEGKKGISDAAFILLAIDGYLNPNHF